MPRGKLWDDLTFGPARRRRSMLRRLEELDHLDRAATQQGSVGRDLLRRTVVGLVTSAMVAGATLYLLDRGLGIHVSLNGIDRRAALGRPQDVARGVGTFRFVSHQPGAGDEPVTYDPCRPVEIVVNGVQAPKGSDGIVDEAVEHVSKATGLALRIVGRSDEKASPDRPSRDLTRYGRGWSPVLIAWTDPEEVPGLAGHVAGLGGSHQHMSTWNGRAYYDTGGVWLDAPQLTRVLARPDGRALVEAIVLHELGHLVGLDHVNDPRELMNEENVGLRDFGPGDREGLAALGAGRCS